MLDVQLPAGWTERPNDGPRTFSPKPDDSAGVLQLSTLPDKDHAFIANQVQLGAFAAEVGARLGWGHALGAKDATCALGRLGLATFANADFPVMFLFIAVSQRAAYMWTWLGPSHEAPEVPQALRIVVEARER